MSFISKNLHLLLSRFFFGYSFCMAITSEKHIKRGGVTVFVSQQKDNWRKGQFRLQIRIVREGTGASFKTNTF